MKRFLPLFILIILMVAAYVFDLANYFSFDQLKAHRESLQLSVSDNPVLAALCFMLIYTLSTALSVPGAAFLSIAGGFLFPQPFATIYVVLGASLGACLIFLAAKTALHDFLKAKAGGLLDSMSEGFQENAASYLLFLRLVPVFPFWLVNLAPAFFGVSLLTFAWTTCIGITPGAFVFTQAGAGLGAIFDSGESFSIGGLFNYQMKIALISLGVFALIPIVIKKIKRKKTND
jgi:uncharacterized membrane protein YdjX (TVP38/TMEM64 family)